MWNQRVEICIFLAETIIVKEGEGSEENLFKIKSANSNQCDFIRWTLENIATTMLEMHCKWLPLLSFIYLYKYHYVL